MKLSDKLKAYLIWGCIMAFFASLGQFVVCMLFNSPRYHNHIAFVILSVFNWLAFGILAHVWARDDSRGSKSPSLDQAIGVTKQFGTNRKCPKCGSELVFDHTSDRGTTVEFRADRLPFPRKVNLRTIRNARMPFLWVYFKCPKCGWGLCTTSKSKDVFIVKSDEGKTK